MSQAGGKGLLGNALNHQGWGATWGGGGLMGSLTGLVSTLGLQMLSLIVGGIFLLGGIGSWWMTTMAPAYYAALNASDVSGIDALDGDLMQMINSQNAVLVGVAMERSFKENINGNSISPNTFNHYDSNDTVWQVVIKKLKAGNNGSIPDPKNASPMQCAYFIYTAYEVAGHPLPTTSPTAIGYWNNEDVRSAFQSHGWNYIDNGKGVPSPGDLVVLDGPTPGAAGHIAMVVGVDSAQGGSDGYVYMVQANAPNNYVKNAATHLTFMRWPLTSDKYMKSGWSHYTVMGFIHNKALSQKWGDPFHASSGSDIRAKIVAAARKEYAKNIHETGNNCNPYGPCGEWCALFASWTWRQAGININIAYVPNYQDYGQKHGTLHKGLSNPQPGDAIIFHTPGHSYTHVGIIVEVRPNGEVISIEGNHRDRVDKVGPYRLNGMRPGNDYAEAIVSPPIPSGGAKCDKNAPALSDVQARSLAAQAGFTGHGLDVIVAIAHAESSLNPKNCNVNSDSRRTLDRGILQINNYWHSEVTDACAFDAQCAFEQGYRISSHGTHFTHVWSTYDSGAYRRYMP